VTTEPQVANDAEALERARSLEGFFKETGDAVGRILHAMRQHKLNPNGPYVERMAQLESFVERIARTVQDAECVTCLRDGTAPNDKCPQHGPAAVPGDVALGQRRAFIIEARELLGGLE
jgi:hypothetical protein